jgi:hypothetical protein
MLFPRRGAPFTSLMEAAVSAAINPAIIAARVRALMDAHGGGRLPFPDQRDPVARDQLGRERRIPFPVAKPEEHFKRMAVSATGFL